MKNDMSQPEGMEDCIFDGKLQVPRIPTLPALPFPPLPGLPESLQEIADLAEKEGVKLMIPIWLHMVPEEKRLEAIKRCIKGHAQRQRRAKEREQQVRAIRQARKEEVALPINTLMKEECSIVYMDVLSYRIVLAYKAGDKPNEIYVWFSVCSPNEVIDDCRRNAWMHTGRCIVAQRVLEDDLIHGFACLVQGQAGLDPKTLDYFVRRRFIEYMMLTSEGLPRDLVELIRFYETHLGVFNLHLKTERANGNSLELTSCVE